MSYPENFIVVQFMEVPDDFKASDEVDEFCQELGMNGPSVADDITQTIACTGSATTSLSSHTIEPHTCRNPTRFTVKGKFSMTKDQIYRLKRYKMNLDCENS